MPEKPLRILIGADTYPPDINGAAQFGHRLAMGMRDRGHEVHVVAARTGAGPIGSLAALAARANGATEVVVTNTLPVPEERRFEGLTVLSIAPLIARAIKEVFEDGSVTSLFNGVS